ncbi:MFS general substrate transporter [Hortaea werneckii]|nr:MFS general substrate transporter [Hortaea werneckii]KAI7666830.1 MFS general substrate transporter [Hortaea werneckii]
MELKPHISHTESTRSSAADHEPAKGLEKYTSELDTIQENDVGFREYLEGLDLDFSESEQRKVRWKIDLVILPIFLITQMLQFIDKTALNYANIFGYQDDLKLVGKQFNYLAAMVYAGYFFGQYPCGVLIGRYPAQKVLGICCLLWGLMVLILTQCHTFSSALAVRFIMGIFEAAVTPGLTLMTGFWYKRSEIPLRQCIWYSSLGWGGIVGSYISMGITKLAPDTQPARWEILFFILGGATMIWSFVIYFLLPDVPSNARFFNHREKLVAVHRVAGNDTGIKNKHFDRKQAVVAFWDPKAILLFISVFAAAIPNGVVNSFSTIIIKDMGFTNTRTTELKSVGDAVQIVALLIGGTVTLNVRNSRLCTATFFNVLCTIAAACMAFLPRSETWARLACFWLVNAQSVGFTVSLVTISSNMGGYTHRAMANAFVFTAYCWGNFAGPFVVKPSQAPEYTSATIGLLVGYAIKTVCHLSLLVGVGGAMGDATKLDLAEWNRDMAINVTSMMLMSRHIIPEMRKQGRGSIVNMSSVSGLLGGNPSLLYPTSKGAIIQMTRAMAAQHGPENIRVNCVCPGMVFTPMVRSRDMTDEMRQARINQNLLKREGDAWDVAHAILFLCGRESKWITGLVMPVDGGTTAGKADRPALKADTLAAETTGKPKL